MATQAAIVKRPVLEMINASKPQFEGRLPQGMTSERFMYGLATSVQKNSALMNCDPKSVMLAAYEAAEVGCDLSPSLAHGWIIPYGNQAQFQPSYRFFIQKAYDTGRVAAFYAEVVYERDSFYREFAPKRTLRHLPPNDNNRGEPIGAYALIDFKDGHLDFEYLTTEQIQRHRKHSKVPGSLMWTTFWEEGFRKTPIRALFKRLPLSDAGMQQLAELVNRDAENDADPIIPGTLEVEHVAGSNGGNGKQVSEVPDQQPKQDDSGEPVNFNCGTYLTTLTGAALRKRFTTAELKPFGMKVIDNKWTIPVDNTEAFLKLCEDKGMQVVEVDSEGKPVPAANHFKADAEHSPEGLF